MTTSAVSISARSAVFPASVRRSNTTERLPRLTLTNTPLRPGAGPTEMYRVVSPSGGSTLITSAPISAMIWVQYGPITIAVRSTIRTPASGPDRSVGLVMLSSLPVSLRHREAVPDVFAVPVGHHRKHQRRTGIADSLQLLAHLLDRPRRLIHPGGFGDDGACHASGDGDEHLAADRAGF